MATLDDILTTQKNGVVAINNLNQTMQAIDKLYGYLNGQYTSLGYSTSGVITNKPGRLVSVNTVVAGTASSTFFNYITYATTATAGTGGAGGVATITYNGASLFSVGDSVYVAGVVPSGYNGLFTVTGTPTSNQITYALPSVTGSQTVPGTVFNVSTANKIAASSTTIGTLQVGSQFSNGIYVSIGTGQTVAVNYSLD